MHPFFESESLPVYFGNGCFWHTQHEFVEAERRILGRSDDELTALAGYAGGRRVGQDGMVCYHNSKNVAEYGTLGHAEVVGLEVPLGAVGRFAKVYFGLFDSNGDRPDKADRGDEYRALVGIPGGMASPLFPEVAAAAAARGVSWGRSLGL